MEDGKENQKKHDHDSEIKEKLLYIHRLEKTVQGIKDRLHLNEKTA